MTVSFPIYRRICVVGGGPAGLAIGKALALEPIKFDTIDIFERRDLLGGLWNFGGDKTKVDPAVPSPSQHENERLDPNGGFENKFFSPMYKNLETNIIGTVMEYQGVKFPSEAERFPTRQQVANYMSKYSETLPKNINIVLNANVVEMKKDESIWNVSTEDTKSGAINNHQYDAVVIANGHFDAPFIPDVPGLKAWDTAIPKSITHAKYYVQDTDYKDKTVLVVGNLSSGLDISIQLAASAKQVYVSSSEPEKGHNIPAVTHINVVANYNHKDRSVTTFDGQSFANIDTVIFCTGYFYKCTFLKSYPEIITDGRTLHDLHENMFYIKDPSLAFAAINHNIIPMPFAESQGAIIARVFSGRLSLPSQAEMEAEYEKVLASRIPGKSLHFMGYPKDIEYLKHLQSIIDENHLEKEGLHPPVWDEAREQLRAKTEATKAARVLDVIEFVRELRNNGELYRLLDK